MDLSRLLFSEWHLKKKNFQESTVKLIQYSRLRAFKAAVCNAGDPGSIPGLGRSSGEEMATHSSTVAWKIPCTEKLGRLQFMGSQGVGHDWATSLHSVIQASVFCKMRSLDKKVLMFSFPLSSTLKCIKLWCLIHVLSLLDRTLCSHCA